MKRTPSKFLVAVAGIAWLAGCAAPHQANHQWEYKVAEVRSTELQPELNKVGMDGWEAVSAYYIDFSTTVVLKRPRQ